jgi:hypothetical protein
MFRKWCVCKLKNLFGSNARARRARAYWILVAAAATITPAALPKGLASGLRPHDGGRQRSGSAVHKIECRFGERRVAALNALLKASAA